VSYRDEQRLDDIAAAIAAIRAHLTRGTLADGLIFDAVRIRLLEIGEAVKALPAELLATDPSIPWSQIARMRDNLAHRYFDTDHAIVQATVDNDLDELDTPARRPLSTSTATSGRTRTRRRGPPSRPQFARGANLLRNPCGIDLENRLRKTLEAPESRASSV
jgi:uncharacterized protein with HEPN domain